MAALRVLGATLLVALVVAPAAPAAPASVAYALSGSELLTFDPAAPGGAAATAITGVVAGETLVGLDVRPQNGFLYALGIDAASDTGTLYAISPRTGEAGPVAPGGVAGFELPAADDWGVDFDPVTDRLRAVADALDLRIDPNAGTAVKDPPVAGASLAYTNSRPDATETTLFVLDPSDDTLRTGDGDTVGVVEVDGVPLDFGRTGFDGDPDQPIIKGIAHFTAGSDLYAIDLATAAATRVGAVGDGSRSLRGLALTRADADGGTPVVAVDGSGLSRFLTGSPGTSTHVPATPVAGESLAAVGWRPRTGQLLAFAVDPGADTGTLYVADPQTGALSPIGAPGQVSWPSTDLPDPATTAYGLDVNPVTDRVRVVAASGLNGRIDPGTGAPAGIDDPLPGVSGIAFATGLFALRPSTDELLAVEPPGAAAVLFLDGSGARVDVSAGSLDVPEDGVGEAVAALTVDGPSGLYALDLATGRLYPGGELAAPVRDIAAGLATGRRPHVPGCPCPAAAAESAAPVPAAAPAAGQAATRPRLRRVGRARRRGRRIDTGYQLACPAGATAGCSVTVTLRRRRTRLARAVIAVPAKATKRLRLTLSRRGRRAFGRRRVKATLTFAVAGAQTARVKVTFSGRRRGRRTSGAPR